MNQKMSRQFGLWNSPLTARATAERISFSDVIWDGEGRSLVWREGRSDRGVLVASKGEDAPRDLTSDVNVRAKVGYGGGDFTVHGDQVVFVDHHSGALFCQSMECGVAQRLTPAFGFAASPVVSPDGAWIAYIHQDDRQQDCIAVIDRNGRQWPQILTQGHDFYTQLRWSPDGSKVAFVAWDHPQMPWDGAFLYMADVIKSGSDAILPRLSEPKVIAGGQDVAVFQPEFSKDGRFITFVCDQSGWSHLYRYDLNTGDTVQVTQMDDAEFGMPNWIQEMRTYGLHPNGRIAYAAVNKTGFVRLCEIDLETGGVQFVEPASCYTDVSQISVSSTGHVAMIASSSQIPPRIVVYAPDSGRMSVLARSGVEALGEEDLSPAQALTWKTSDGDEAHGLYYEPHSKTFSAPGKPPLIVLVHGGPTSQYLAGYHPQTQFFTTRGYAVLEVNYRGSTGYGRRYMKKLQSMWGIYDVDDAVSGARHLDAAGKVDGRRTAIMGGSAGGFTVLQTMVREPDAFTVGLSLFGVANQFTLAAGTHKFEERYLDSLLGPLPEAADLYRERSPVFHAENIRRPLAVFQGTEDKVVPQEQSDVIVEALKSRGILHEYHVYEGEGHGWRKTETIERFYEAVERFLKTHLIYT